MSVKRNDPCPCGSGKKFKKCCGAGDRPAAAPKIPAASLLQQASQHHMAGRLAEAEAFYRQALDAADGRASALHGLGVIAFQRGRAEDACELINQAIELKPDVALYHFNLGKAGREAGRLDVSEAAYRAALELDPRHLPSLENLGNLLAHMIRYAEAARCFRRALELQPNNEATRRALGVALWRSGRLSEGVEVYRQAARGPMARLRLALMECTTQDSREAMEGARAELFRALDEAAGQTPFDGTPDDQIDVTCFHTAYHGENERDLLALTGRVLAAGFPALNFVAPHCRPGAPRAARPKPRIGLVSAFLGEHSVTRYLGRMLEGIDTDRFELHVFSRPGQRGGSLDALRQRAARFVELQPPLARLQSEIARSELDVLVHVDIGMHPLTYALAFARLAPVQATTYGHPVTSGIPAIDYFVSHAGVEAPDAAEHYSERLLLTPPEATLCCFRRPPPVARARDRAALGIAADAHFYLCPQNLLKVHPDFDPILRRLLERDAKAVIAFICDKEDWRPRLEARHARTLGELAKRTCYLPFQDSREDYYGLYLACDAVLDTPHFSGGVTSFDALAMGAPIVTLPGRYFRGRQTLALYRRMGVEDCVAADADDYVEIALRLAGDTDFAGRVRAEIAARSDLIFDDAGAIDAWNEALGTLARSAPSAG